MFVFWPRPYIEITDILCLLLYQNSKFRLNYHFKLWPNATLFLYLWKLAGFKPGSRKRSKTAQLVSLIFVCPSVSFSHQVRSPHTKTPDYQAPIRGAQRPAPMEFCCDGQGTCFWGLSIAGRQAGCPRRKAGMNFFIYSRSHSLQLIATNIS